MGKEIVSVAAIVDERMEVVGHRYIKVSTLESGTTTTISDYMKSKLKRSINENTIPVVYQGGQVVKQPVRYTHIKDLNNEIGVYSTKDCMIELKPRVPNASIETFCRKCVSLITGVDKSRHHILELIMHNTILNDGDYNKMVVDCYNVVKSMNNYNETKDGDKAIARVLELSLRRNPMLMIGTGGYLQLNNGITSLVVNEKTVVNERNKTYHNIKLISTNITDGILYLKIRVAADKTKIKPYNVEVSIKV